MSVPYVSPEEIVPSDKNARACKVCSLVKNMASFYEHGCDNCNFLHMDGDRDRVFECTSNQYDGLICLNKPGESWVARWQSLPTQYVRGVYAVNVLGTLKKEILDELAADNITVKSRQKE